MFLPRLLPTLLLVPLLAAAFAPAAAAHQMNVSSARVTFGPANQVDVEVGIRGSDVDEAVGTQVTDVMTEQARPDAVAAGAAAIGAYVAERIGVAGTASCRPGAPAVRPDEDGVAVHITFDCAGVGGALTYRSTVLADVVPAAQQVVMVYGAGAPFQALLDARTDTVEIGAPPGLLRVMVDYAAAGVEHIFLGYDHVAFLLALMLWARRPGPVVKIVTAFTLAHSITLSLAALDVLRLSPAIVEPAIAASIVFVAVENFVSRDVGRRWRVAFLFGFVHGFGFADALRERGVPRSALVPALAAFNLGVEAGQLAIVALIFPALLLLDRAAGGRRGRAPAAVYAASAAIVAFGCWWFAARTLLA